MFIKLLLLMIAVFMMAGGINAYEPATPAQEKALQAEYQKYLQSQGISLPTQGVQVVPRNALSLPAELKSQIQKNVISLQKQGFVENRNPRIIELRDIDHTAAFEKKKYQNTDDPASTHLRDAIADIRMAYEFHEVPSAMVNNIIGFAPVGTFKQDGWTGMVELFTKTGLGNCNYEENNLKLMHASIRIPADMVSYDVNNKITTIDIQGNLRDGFLYTVAWYDDQFARKLECVTPNYSQDTRATVVAMARKIDG